jgi:hypothetical protein
MWDGGCYNKLTFELRTAFAPARKQFITFQQLAEAATDHVQNSSRGSSSNNNTTPKNSASISAPGSLPASTTSRPLTRLTGEERDHFNAKNRYFSCHEVGHASWDCPRNKEGNPAPIAAVELTADMPRMGNQNQGNE